MAKETSGRWETIVKSTRWSQMRLVLSTRRMITDDGRVLERGQTVRTQTDDHELLDQPS